MVGVVRRNEKLAKRSSARCCIVKATPRCCDIIPTLPRCLGIDNAGMHSEWLVIRRNVQVVSTTKYGFTSLGLR